MTKKDKCRELMGKLFGPATAKLVDTLTEEEVVDYCKKKVTGLLGAEKAKMFDGI
jgi:hypothetical protein